MNANDDNHDNEDMNAKDIEASHSIEDNDVGCRDSQCATVAIDREGVKNTRHSVKESIQSMQSGYTNRAYAEETL